MMSRQASTEPNIRSKSRRSVSCSRLGGQAGGQVDRQRRAADAAGRPVTVMICGPRDGGAGRILAAAEQPGDDLEQLARLGRQGEELAGPGADGLEDQRAVAGWAGGQDDGVGLDLAEGCRSARRPGPGRRRGRPGRGPGTISAILAAAA